MGEVTQHPDPRVRLELVLREVDHVRQQMGAVDVRLTTFRTAQFALLAGVLYVLAVADLPLSRLHLVGFAGVSSSLVLGANVRALERQAAFLDTYRRELTRLAGGDDYDDLFIRIRGDYFARNQSTPSFYPHLLRYNIALVAPYLIVATWAVRVFAGFYNPS